MAISYIAMLTAFYVDNEPHLPFWNRLPVIAFWLLPGTLGVPLLAVVWLKQCPPRNRFRMTI
jgi:hypothetical protein